MRWSTRAVCSASVALAVIATFVEQPRAAQNTPPAQAKQEPATPKPLVVHPPEKFVGTWEYNAAESVNAANGRPERSPQSATQRRPTSTPRPPSSMPPGGGGIGYGPGGGNAGGPLGIPGPPMGPGMPSLVTTALRDLARDLLEISETLTIRVTEEGVIFTDDLDRSQTYPPDGEKYRYQIGAALFDAKTIWERGQLKKAITASEGFKMSETYFLSDDAKRLFVIIRLGEQRKGTPVVGVNRVYDRVDSRQ